jgi:hypothetical protein
MSLAVRCSHCGAAYSLAESLQGKSVRCKACRGTFPVGPSSTAVTEPATVVPIDEPAAPSPKGLQTAPGRAPLPRATVDEPRRYRDEEPRPSPSRSGWPIILIIVGVAAAVLLLFVGLSAVGVALLFLTPVSSSSSQSIATSNQAVRIDNGEPPAPLERPLQVEQPQPRRGVPIVVPPADPVTLTPPALDQAKVVVALPDTVKDVAIGGGGRYLILHLPARKELAIFDVSAAKLVKSIPASAPNIKFAAGMDKLIVVRPDDNVIERWSLKTFQRETTAKVAMEVPPVAVAVGCASNGPLVISGCDWPRLGETVFFDIIEMKKLDVIDEPHNFFHTNPNVQLRASADGKVFACQNEGTAQIAVCGADGVQYYSGGASYSVPGADGKVIYTDGGRYTPQMQPLPGDRVRLLPARQGAYYLSFSGPGRPGPPRDDGRGSVFVHAADGRVVTRLDDVDGVAEGPGLPNGLPFDQRIHFIPDAKVLITIAATNDKLILYRLDVAGK